MTERKSPTYSQTKKVALPRSTEHFAQALCRDSQGNISAFVWKLLNSSTH